MNPLAAELNQQIEQASPVAFSLLSDLGKQMYFPKGILYQSAQAKEKAHRFNATIGTATENGAPMHLGSAQKYYNLEAKDIYPYAPPAGRPKLRALWAEKIRRQNPSLGESAISLPVVTSAITHGLTLAGQLFLNPGDVVVAPNKLWGNYRLTFETMIGAKISTFEMFTDEGAWNQDAFEALVRKQSEETGKVIVLLNFPNNPTGYTPSLAEANQIVDLLVSQAAAGVKVLAITDDSYFGLFFGDSIKESLFGRLAGAHENLLALKLDGATKEYYAWGLRTGFITFGHPAGDSLFGALEKKVQGLIRGGISNCTHASQTVVEGVLQDPNLETDWKRTFDLMAGRARKVAELLKGPEFSEVMSHYPFNSGYFMCLKLDTVDAEALRLHLLETYGVGTIAINSTDLRVAFSCIEEGDVEELFGLIRKGILDLSS